MNIKNKPIIQMDEKEQIIYNLRREAALLKVENDYIKQEIYKMNGGKPIETNSLKLPPIKITTPIKKHRGSNASINSSKG
jgi:hypothetical protein